MLYLYEQEETTGRLKAELGEERFARLHAEGTIATDADVAGWIDLVERNC